MNCQRFREIVGDGSIDLRAADPQADAARIHRDTCSECLAYLNGQNMLRSALQNLKEEDAMVVIPEKIRQNLMASYRNRTQSVKSLSYFKYSTLSAAAVLIVAIGAALWFETALSIPKTRQPAVRSSSNLKSKQNALPVSRSEKSSDLVTTKKPQTDPGATQKNDSQLASEVATEFFPLGPSDQNYGELQRVRVMVPRASLIQFGLPMNEDRATEPITADLLVAEDGIPHAIRFVQYMN